MEINAASSATTYNSTASTSATTSSTSSGASSNISIDDFFTLLAAQLSNQSMFNPVEDTEFMAQMAQFSTLQQMQQLTQTFNTVMSVSLVGKQVTAQVLDALNNATVYSGVVDGVEISNGKSYLCIGDMRIDPDNLTSVTG